MKSKFSIFVIFWKEKKQRLNPVLWCGVNVRRAGGWLGSRLPAAAYELPGGHSHLPPFHLSIHTSNSLFANQRIGGRVAIMTYWTMQPLHGHFPSAFGLFPGPGDVCNGTLTQRRKSGSLSTSTITLFCQQK